MVFVCLFVCLFVFVIHDLKTFFHTSGGSRELKSYVGLQYVYVKK